MTGPILEISCLPQHPTPEQDQQRQRKQGQQQQCSSVCRTVALAQPQVGVQMYLLCRDLEVHMGSCMRPTHISWLMNSLLRLLGPVLEATDSNSIAISGRTTGNHFNFV